MSNQLFKDLAWNDLLNKHKASSPVKDAEKWETLRKDFALMLQDNQKREEDSEKRQSQSEADRERNIIRTLRPRVQKVVSVGTRYEPLSNDLTKRMNSSINQDKRSIVPRWKRKEGFIHTLYVNEEEEKRKKENIDKISKVIFSIMSSVIVDKYDKQASKLTTEEDQIYEYYIRHERDFFIENYGLGKENGYVKRRVLELVNYIKPYERRFLQHSMISESIIIHIKRHTDQLINSLLIRIKDRIKNYSQFTALLTKIRNSGFNNSIQNETKNFIDQEFNHDRINDREYIYEQIFFIYLISGKSLDYNEFIKFGNKYIYCFDKGDEQTFTSIEDDPFCKFFIDKYRIILLHKLFDKREDMNKEIDFVIDHYIDNWK